MNDLDWKVTVPEYDARGVRIARFEITEREASFDKLRTALNPQRGDRSVEAGWYTKLVVDDVLWMTDTPAECNDLDSIDNIMSGYDGGTMLIVGLGLGVVLNHAILRGMSRIDVVEAEDRVIDAVGEHYTDLAKEHDTILNIHRSDIHDWRAPGGRTWDIGFFDIWAHIDMDDRAEVARLRSRFRNRLSYFEAWAQDERNAQAKRIREKRGFY